MQASGPIGISASRQMTADIALGQIVAATCGGAENPETNEIFIDEPDLCGYHGGIFRRRNADGKNPNWGRLEERPARPPRRRERGDRILVCEGVAIARVAPSANSEPNYVSGHTW